MESSYQQTKLHSTIFHNPFNHVFTCLKQKGIVKTLTPTMLFTTFMIRPEFEAVIFGSRTAEISNVQTGTCGDSTLR